MISKFAFMFDHDKIFIDITQIDSEVQKTCSIMWCVTSLLISFCGKVFGQVQWKKCVAN